MSLPERNCSTGRPCAGEGPDRPFPSRIHSPAGAPPAANLLLCPTGRLLATVMSYGGASETERCIESLLKVFNKYAAKDGDKKEGDACTLSKEEFVAFMKTELASFTKAQKDPGVLDRMMKKLDLNSDGKLDFGEFLNLIGGLAQACHSHVMCSPTSGSHKKP